MKTKIGIIIGIIILAVAVSIAAVFYFNGREEEERGNVNMTRKQ